MDGDRLTLALRIALEAHDGQLRKGTDIPYISHPLGVASLVMEDGGSDDEVAAAILHDAVEDGGDGYVARIREALGRRVTDVVLECSDSVLPAGAEKPPWKGRKQAYIARIPGESTEAIRVTTADKLHNARAVVSDLRAIGPAVFERFTGGRDGALWYFRTVTEALAVHPAARPRLVAELRRVVDEMERLAGGVGFEPTSESPR